MIKLERPIPDEFPKQQFKRQEKLADKLLLEVMKIVGGNELAGKHLEYLVDTLATQLTKTRQLSRTVLMTTVSELAGQKATTELLKPFLYRLTANLERLYRGQPVGQFNPDRYVGWAVIEFTDMFYFKQKENVYLRYKIKSLSGLSFGLSAYKTYSPGSSHIDALLYKLGAAGKGSTSSPRELVQLRLWGELVQQNNDGVKAISYGRWTIDKQLKAYNSKKVRARRKACPFGYKWACAKCPIGYDESNTKIELKNQCDLGCRSITDQERKYELLKHQSVRIVRQGPELQHQGNPPEHNSADSTSSQPVASDLSS